MPTNKFFLQITANFGVVVGDGGSLLFQNNVWLANMVLKDEFPRLYTLAVNKQGYVPKFGN